MTISKRRRDRCIKVPNLGKDKEVCLPTSEFLSKYDLEKIRLDEKNYALRVKDKRPIDKYHRLYLIDKIRDVGEQYRRGINEDQFYVANRLSNNYERIFSNLSRPLGIIGNKDNANTSMYPTEFMIYAINNHKSVMKELSYGSREIIGEICCKETNLITYEHAKGWRKGYGMIRLREALDELDNVYKDLRGS